MTTFHRQLESVQNTRFDVDDGRNTGGGKSLLKEIGLSMIPGYLGWKVGKKTYNFSRRDPVGRPRLDRYFDVAEGLFAGALFGLGVEVAAVSAGSNVVSSTSVPDLLGGAAMYALTHVGAGGLCLLFDDGTRMENKR